MQNLDCSLLILKETELRYNIMEKSLLRELYKSTVPYKKEINVAARYKPKGE